MLLSLTTFSPRLTDTFIAETDIFNLLYNFVMFIPTPSPTLNTNLFHLYILLRKHHSCLHRF